jgi:SulP family sulfate permease
LDSANRSQHHQAPPSFAELFTPKLITVLREGYGRTKFQADVIAGLAFLVVTGYLRLGIYINSFPIRSRSDSPPALPSSSLPVS